MHRFRRHVHIRRQHESPPVFVGALFLLIGVLFFLQTFGLIQIRDVIGQFWPAIIVAWGIGRLWTGRGRVLGAGAVALGSLMLANRVFGLEFSAWGLVWSIVFLGMGTHVLLRNWQRTRRTSDDDVERGPTVIEAETVPPIEEDRSSTASTINESAVLGSIERRNTSQIFKGGQIAAMMGSAEIDLTGTRMAGDTATIDVNVVMGAVVLEIPRDWNIESRTSVLMGSLEDRSRAPDVPGKTLIIGGDIVLGTVEVKN